MWSIILGCYRSARVADFKCVNISMKFLEAMLQSKDFATLDCNTLPRIQSILNKIAAIPGSRFTLHMMWSMPFPINGMLSWNRKHECNLYQISSHSNLWNKEPSKLEVLTSLQMRPNFPQELYSKPQLLQMWIFLKSTEWIFSTPQLILESTIGYIQHFSSIRFFDDHRTGQFA